jgi:catechol 2,3-dioxygenase-like lactoylglutathione lyase family enzyme
MPRVFDHVGVWVSDRAESERFYATVLATLGRTPDRSEDYTEWGDFAIGASPERPVTRHLHVAFFAPTHEAVDAFWRAGVDAGYRSDGEPGRRPEYGEDYYGGFLLDPDGNSVEAVNLDARRESGQIDHLWIGVADTAAARRFYATIAPHCGLTLGTDTPERVQLRGGDFTFSLVADGRPATENLHIAFPGSRDAVRAFHAAATGAGYRDNGAPGERPEYHEGYYAAFVHDPDGTNVEVVDHGRPTSS